MQQSEIHTITNDSAYLINDSAVGIPRARVGTSHSVRGALIYRENAALTLFCQFTNVPADIPLHLSV